MSVRNSVAAIALTSIDSSTFTGSYQLINTGGLANACFLLRIINNSNRDVTISYDGSTDNDVVQTLATIQLPLQSNNQPTNNIALIPKGTKVWVKASAGTGSVYLAGYTQVVAN